MRRAHRRRETGRADRRRNENVKSNYWNQKASQLAKAGSLSLFALTLIYCGKPLIERSHLELSQEESLRIMELRVSKTEELRSRLESIREALKPMGKVLKDVDGVLNLDAQSKAEETFSEAVVRLDKILKQASQGLVEFANEAGEWTLVASFEGKGSKKDILPYKTVVLNGTRDGDAEVVAFSLASLQTGKSVQLGVLRVSKRGEVSFAYDPSALGQSLPQEQIQAGSCVIDVTLDRAKVDCEPLHLVHKNRVVELRTFSVTKSPAGVDAYVEAGIRNLDGTSILDAELTVIPGEKTKVMVCIPNSGCKTNLK